MLSEFRIEAMDCPVEEQIIRKRLSKVSEVYALEFDLVSRKLTVEHTFSDDEPLKAILNEIGMGPEAECQCCNGHKKPSRQKADLLLVASLAMAIIAEVIGFVTKSDHSIPVVLFSVAAIAFGGIPTFKKGWIALKTLALNINFLMSIAVFGALAIGSFPEAAMVIVLFAIAERIESLSLDRARNAVRSLLELAPETAEVNRNNEWICVPASEVLAGEVIRAKPGERIAADGEVISGSGSVDQAPITGESIPVQKEPGAALYAGTINQEGVLHYRVTNASGSTTLDRIIKTVQEAQGTRANSQRFIDEFAKYYTPAVVVFALLIAVVPTFFGQPFLPWFYKALVMLVIACPCALVISTPVTIVSGLASAARKGILVKGGVYLEAGRKLTTIAVDKTGTITQGKPAVQSVQSLHQFDVNKARQLAASLDHLSTHPIAAAVVKEWEGPLIPVQDFRNLAGRGVTGTVEGETYSIGNHRLIEELGICCDHVHTSLAALEEQGVSTVLLANSTEVIAIFAVADAIRKQSIEGIQELKRLDIDVAMLTGDNEATAKSIAKKVGIDQVYSEMLPESKFLEIDKLIQSGKVVGMVGDGINDAPALAKANIGFAMGAAGTDTAIETADVALMDDDLGKIAEFVRLSKSTAAILTQNIATALLIKLIFFVLAISGEATLWMAVFADMGASLLVVGNSLRLLRK